MRRLAGFVIASRRGRLGLALGDERVRLYDLDAESALLVDVYAFPTTARVTPTFRRRDGQPLPLGRSVEFRGNPLTDDSVLRIVGRTIDEFLLDYLGATEETCESADPGDEVGSVDPVFPVREPERVASESSSLDFTRGSHRDDVLRIQGTPSSINQYSDHETWWYGVSTIDISLRDQRVTEWNNLGRNLKVSLDAGPNVTDAQTFTRGSQGEGVSRSVNSQHCCMDRGGSRRSRSAGKS